MQAKQRTVYVVSWLPKNSRCSPWTCMSMLVYSGYLPRTTFARTVSLGTSIYMRALNDGDEAIYSRPKQPFNSFAL
jgi:hypothetical protein